VAPSTDWVRAGVTLCFNRQPKDGSTMKRSLIFVSLMIAFAIAPMLAFAEGGGNVLPAGDEPDGYSLEDMAKLLAAVAASYNGPQYYPKTPFQILALPFVNPHNPIGNPHNPIATPLACPDPPGGAGFLGTGGNTFVVRSETPFFVPLFSFDDSQ